MIINNALQYAERHLGSVVCASRFLQWGRDSDRLRRVLLASYSVLTTIRTWLSVRRSGSKPRQRYSLPLVSRVRRRSLCGVDATGLRRLQHGKQYTLLSYCQFKCGPLFVIFLLCSEASLLWDEEVSW